MICTVTIPDCGPLGDVGITVSYRFIPARHGSREQPAEPATALIYWTKLGDERGQEIHIADDYLRDEIIPACVSDYVGCNWREAA